MNEIKEYDLKIPWDLSTAKFSDGKMFLSTAKFSADGSKMFIYPDEDKEIAIREKYPDVKRLYEEYRVVLILAAGEKL